MKKYLFSALAVVFAIAASSFTILKNKPAVDTYVFEYNPTISNNYTQLRVENRDKAVWVYQGTNLPLCSGSNFKACRISIPIASVNFSTTPYSLSTSAVTISSAASGAGVYYVTAIASPGSISNKP